jgi:hypothetical protein
MWYIFIFICFVLTNFSSSLPIITFDHHQQIRSLQSIDDDNNLVNLNICSTQSINIDKTVNEIDIHHSTSTTITTIDIGQFVSSWERDVVTNNDHSVSLNIIQIVFTIPYKISNESILNKTVFITDVIHYQLLAILTDVCLSESSFFINYSTIQPLPQNICLYLLLNLTSSMILREIIFCRTIEDLHNNNTLSLNDTQSTTNQSVGPSGFFILSQCIIILIMMFTIYGVHTAREKNFLDRVNQRLLRSRPYITIFGKKTVVRTGSRAVNPSSTSATTIQAGLNQIAFHHRLKSLPNYQINLPIEEQVLAAKDLTSTINDRRATRPCISRDLINVKEFTKRMSLANENSTDTESYRI